MIEKGCGPAGGAALLAYRGLADRAGVAGVAALRTCGASRIRSGAGGSEATAGSRGRASTSETGGEVPSPVSGNDPV